MDKPNKNKENIYKLMWQIAQKMEKLKATNRYDVDALLYSLSYQLDQLNYFYKDLIDKQGNNNANNTYYNLKTNPKEHQLIYVNLCRGFPKELYDGHWCYVFKHSGTKLLVIPTTSFKDVTSSEDRDYYFDIEESDGTKSRLRFDEMRMIDKMRVDYRDKPYRNVKTDRKLIEEKFLRFLNLTLDKSKE